MFSGIVTGLGALVSRESNGDDLRMRFTASSTLLDGARLGDSMSVSGVCLTMLDINTEEFSADVSIETLGRTTLGAWTAGRPVNLEPALRAADRLGGHLVSGHVDGRARLLRRDRSENSERFSFAWPSGLARYIAGKGSVCLDGVSLTVNGVSEDGFDVCLLPHTLEVTTLGRLEAGMEVNIEVDMIARYLERLLPDTCEPG